jgi:hypothetical protein
LIPLPLSGRPGVLLRLSHVVQALMTVAAEAPMAVTTTE